MPSKPPARNPIPKRRKPVPKQDEAASAEVQSDVDDDSAPSTGKPKAQRINVQGLKYFDMLLPLLEQLHCEKCSRDKAGNRELFFDKYCMLVLLYMFNPTEETWGPSSFSGIDLPPLRVMMIGLSFPCVKPNEVSDGPNVSSGSF